MKHNPVVSIRTNSGYARLAAARLAASLVPLVIPAAGGATITFIGGNTTWTDNANTANFTPADEPDADDDLVFNQPNTVSLGSNNVVLSLAMSNGISLDTNDFDLTVDGLLQLAGTGTDLTIGGSASSVNADSVTINSGADIVLEGGSLAIAEESGAGLLDLNDGGILSGQGTVNLNDLTLGSATTLFSNSGTLSATAGLFIGSPPAGTLSINAGDAVNARLDLDALAPVTSVVNVFRNQTLDVNVTLNDAYSGNLNLTHNATLDIASPWSIDAGATVDIDNGFFDGPTPITDIPASTSFIAGGAFTQTGGTITVVDTDGALQFDAPFTMSGGTLVNNGEVIFNANSNIGAGTSFTMPAATSSLTVNPGIVVDVDQPDFNADGGGFTTNVITIGAGGNLDLDLGAGADEGISGTLNLNGGEVDVTTADDSWSIDGIVNVGAATGTSQVNGEPVTFTSVPVAVGTSSTLDVNAVSTWSAGASLSVGSGATVELSSPVFNAPGTINGAGTLRVNFSSQVTGNTTLATDIVDWDGTGTNSLCTIGDAVAFVINTTTFDSDGDMDDNIDLGGNGAALSISGPLQWDFNRIMNANTAVAGSASIGGTSRMVLSGATAFLNVKGNTTVSAPITFGASSTTTVDPGATLTVNGNAIYSGGLITGAGSYLPPTGANNTVSGNTTISTGLFDFDRGSWLVEAGSALTVNVSDYDNTATNLFDSSITLESGTVNVTTGDPQFVYNLGSLTMDNTNGTAPVWDGEPLSIGGDTGIRDANLNITGAGDSRIDTPVTFLSDADVNIAGGCRLVLGANVTFDTVNGTESAEFTGAGELAINGAVSFDEAATIAMTGGIIDLDGTDLVGSTVSLHAPVLLQTGSLRSFGKANIVGTNLLEIDNLAGTGLLNVALDDSAGFWTLNSSGVLNLTNDATVANLLDGVDVVLNGTVNVTGDVRSLARVSIGGTMNIGTAGQAFRLGGGNDSNDPNTIAGGTIQGPGSLGADPGKALVGFGSIHSAIDLGFGSDLLAKDGTLVVDGGISSADDLGTADTDGVLRVVPDWDAGNVDRILMQGGILEGGRIDNNATNGIQGHGLVTARVVNQEGICANNPLAALVVQTPLHDNDWDGSSNDGFLKAEAGATLEIHDNASFAFAGTVAASGGGVVSAKGFDLDLGAASSLLLTGGTFDHGNSVAADIAGTVQVGAGTSVLRMNPANGGYTFKATSTSTILGQLHLDARNTTVEAGASIAGAGRLVNLANRTLKLANLSSVDVLVENRGTGELADASAGRTDLLDFVQTSSGGLNLDLNGTTLGSFDRMIVSGAAQLDGSLRLFKNGYVPAVGDIITLISATGGVSGTFDTVIQPSGMPAGLSFEPVYEANSFKVKVVAADPFGDWINGFASITNPADRAKTANPDHDDLDNLGEFALDGNPASGAASGKIVGKIAPVGGVNALTLTLPVRTGAILDPADPAGGELVLKKSSDAVTYRIQASDNLSSWALTVSEVTGPDATAIQAGLPPLNAGWAYRSFRSPGPVAGDPSEFMRVSISE